MRHLLLLGTMALLLSGGGNSSQKAVMEKLPQEQIAVFVSTDKHWENTYGPKNGIVVCSRWYRFGRVLV